MRISCSIAALMIAVTAPSSASAKATAVCERVEFVIVAGATPSEYVNKQYYPCIVTDANKIDYSNGEQNSSVAGNGRSDSWVSNLRPNETGAIYLDKSDSPTDFRNIVRGAKPYLEGAAYLGSLFAEPLANYHAAALNRNASVDTNLNKVRWAIGQTSTDLMQEKIEKDKGLREVSTQQRQMLANMVNENSQKVTMANTATSDLAARLSKLPQPKPVENLTDLGNRNKLPQELIRNISQAVDPQGVVGSVTLLGSTNPGQALANAVDLELKEYARLSPALLATGQLKQGAEALNQAKYFSSYSPKLAKALYAEARSARAFVTGESKVDEVATWDSEESNFTFTRRADAVNRALHVAILFGDRTNALKKEIAKAAGGKAQRPPDTTLGVTEKLVADAEDQLDSDPVKSLRGLFRARTLIENTKLYGDAWTKLNKWASGAAKRLKEALTPPKTQTEPGGLGKYVATEISKKLKESLSLYAKGVEAGEYATLGINKVQDLFGSDTLTELKKSLQDAYDALDTECKPLAGLDSIAPTVELWVSEGARVANEINSKSEIQELLKLRDLYENRMSVLRTYAQRLEVLSELAYMSSRELESPFWASQAGWNCKTTLCIEELLALSEQLAEVGAYSQNARKKTLATIDRYEADRKKIDQLIDAWLLVLPAPVNGYPVIGVPVRELKKQLP